MRNANIADAAYRLSHVPNIGGAPSGYKCQSLSLRNIIMSITEESLCELLVTIEAKALLCHIILSGNVIAFRGSIYAFNSSDSLKLHVERFQNTTILFTRKKR